MTDKGISLNSELAREVLAELWSIVNREKSGEIDQEIDRLINSGFVAIRYCLPSQLLGKLIDPKLNCLCLQKGTFDDESQWDPRSFAIQVIVPWITENQSVLGTSTDPYVGKPLRKGYLEENPKNVKGKEEWSLLYRVLKEVEDKNSEKFTRLKMLQALRSIHKKYTSLTFEYFIPERISIEQTLDIISSFLSEASGGARGLSVAAAFFKTIGIFFGLYRDVKRYKVNASDQSTGVVADIECIDHDGNLKLAIEVKERNITLIDVRSGILKARKVSLKELLFNAPETNPSEREAISNLFERTWATGTNLYRLSIHELIKVGLSLTGGEGRIMFLENVGRQLDEYSTQPNDRKCWKELLEDI